MKRPGISDANARIHEQATREAEKRLRGRHEKAWKAELGNARLAFRRKFWLEYNELRQMYLEELKGEAGIVDARRNRYQRRSLADRAVPCTHCGAQIGEACRTTSGRWSRPHDARKNANTVQNIRKLREAEEKAS